MSSEYPKTDSKTKDSQQPGAARDKNTQHSALLSNDKSRGHCSDPEDVIKHFVMTKVEKTGTSTLFSVLARFILTNKLNVLQAKSRLHIDWRFRNRKKNHK